MPPREETCPGTIASAYPYERTVRAREVAAASTSYAVAAAAQLSSPSPRALKAIFATTPRWSLAQIGELRESIPGIASEPSGSPVPATGSWPMI